MQAQPPIAVSTWSMHNLLGIMHENGPGVEPDRLRRVIRSRRGDA